MQTVGLVLIIQYIFSKQNITISTEYRIIHGRIICTFHVFKFPTGNIWVVTFLNGPSQLCPYSFLLNKSRENLNEAEYNCNNPLTKASLKNEEFSFTYT